MLSTRVIIVLVLMIVYTVIGLVQIVIGALKFNIHGILSLIATVIIGLGMFLYRLFLGVRTFYVKLIHMLTMLIAVAIIATGAFQINHKEIVNEKYESIHRYPGFVTYAAITLQIILALIFFICLYHKRVRYYIAPFHDMMGVWIYIVMVGCCISAAHKNEKLQKNQTNLILDIEIIAFLMNTIIILVVVLSPYLEWEIVW